MYNCTCWSARNPEVPASLVSPIKNVYLWSIMIRNSPKHTFLAPWSNIWLNFSSRFRADSKLAGLIWRFFGRYFPVQYCSHITSLWKKSRILGRAVFYLKLNFLARLQFQKRFLTFDVLHEPLISKFGFYKYETLWRLHEYTVYTCVSVNFLSAVTLTTTPRVSLLFEFWHHKSRVQSHLRQVSLYNNSLLECTRAPILK